jgi:hypothetical protein
LRHSSFADENDQFLKAENNFETGEADAQFLDKLIKAFEVCQAHVRPKSLELRFDVISQVVDHFFNEKRMTFLAGPTYARSTAWELWRQNGGEKGAQQRERVAASAAKTGFFAKTDIDAAHDPALAAQLLQNNGAEKGAQGGESAVAAPAATSGVLSGDALAKRSRVQTSIDVYVTKLGSENIRVILNHVCDQMRGISRTLDNTPERQKFDTEISATLILLGCLMQKINPQENGDNLLSELKALFEGMKLAGSLYEDLLGLDINIRDFYTKITSDEVKRLLDIRIKPIKPSFFKLFQRVVTLKDSYQQSPFLQDFLAKLGKEDCLPEEFKTFVKPAPSSVRP